MDEENVKIRITSDDVDRAAQLSQPPPLPSPASAPARTWGRVDSSVGSERATTTPANGGLLLKPWFYLGLAGCAAALVAWAVCEPSFRDVGVEGIGNVMLFPALVMFVGIGFAIAESLVERSWQKGVVRASIAFGLGAVLAFIFDYVANTVYRIGVSAIIERVGHISVSNPALWGVRSIAWCVFGISGGIVYGIAGRSLKKSTYGVLGGVIGAGLGGLLFDPIYIVAHAAGPSRCFGMILMGGLTGVAVGLVEAALKDRWLYVSGGPLAGKQFILYKVETSIGASQSNDIYLFKDPSVAPQHATISTTTSGATLNAIGTVLIGGRSVRSAKLEPGAEIQIGRYTFKYEEKHKAG